MPTSFNTAAFSEHAELRRAPCHGETFDGYTYRGIVIGNVGAAKYIMHYVDNPEGKTGLLDVADLFVMSVSMLRWLVQLGFPSREDLGLQCALTSSILMRLRWVQQEYNIAPGDFSQLAVMFKMLDYCNGMTIDETAL